MERKANENTEKLVGKVQKQTEPSVKKAQEQPEQSESGFYCYIGPNLKGLIQTGTIYRGTWKDALAKAEKAIEVKPLVKTLIVSGDALPEARLKVKTPGNVLYANYRELVVEKVMR